MIVFDRKLDVARGRIDLSHGAGGRATTRLAHDIFYPAFANDLLAAGN